MHLAGDEDGQLGFESTRRRLTDVLAEVDFLLVQLLILQSRAGPHRTRDQQARIGALHRRLDRIEQHLRRRADELGEDGRASLGYLRRVLRQKEGRRKSADGAYQGPERRACDRRAC